MSVPKAWVYRSIQDLLTSYGFLVDQDRGWFLKQTVGEEQIIIPFSELMGHTVGSFLVKPSAGDGNSQRRARPRRNQRSCRLSNLTFSSSEFPGRRLAQRTVGCCTSVSSLSPSACFS